MCDTRRVGWPDKSIVVVALFVAPVIAPGGAAWAADPVLVVGINGAPTVQRAGAAAAPLHRGDTVQRGDVVETDAQAKAKLLLADDSVLAIGPRSRVRLDELTLTPAERRARLEVLTGRFKIAIAKYLGGASDYTVSTPTAVAGVRGTILWGDTDRDAICALDGSIEVRPRSGPTVARLGAGECVHQMGSGQTAPLRPSAEELAIYLKEVTLE